jgi:hypothetical protein
MHTDLITPPCWSSKRGSGPRSWAIYLPSRARRRRCGNLVLGRNRLCCSTSAIRAGPYGRLAPRGQRWRSAIAGSTEVVPRAVLQISAPGIGVDCQASPFIAIPLDILNNYVRTAHSTLHATFDTCVPTLRHPPRRQVRRSKVVIHLGRLSICSHQKLFR